MTYYNVLARVDGRHLDEILAAFFVRWETQGRCGDEPSRLQTPQGQADHAHVATRGKTIRATSSQVHPVHQLSCYEVASGIVLWHCHVGAKEHEISALKPRFSPHLIKAHKPGGLEDQSPVGRTRDEASVAASATVQKAFFTACLRRYGGRLCHKQAPGKQTCLPVHLCQRHPHCRQRSMCSKHFRASSLHRI